MSLCEWSEENELSWILKRQRLLRGTKGKEVAESHELLHHERVKKLTFTVIYFI